MDEEKKWMLMTYYCPTHGDSGIVKPIQLTKKEISNTSKKNLFALIDLAFASRRKNIKNNLKKLSINWNEVEIDPTKRPEEISLDDYLLLSKVLVL